jgi:hypothetical protein
LSESTWNLDLFVKFMSAPLRAVEDKTSLVKVQRLVGEHVEPLVDEVEMFLAQFARASMSMVIQVWNYYDWMHDFAAYEQDIRDLYSQIGAILNLAQAQEEGLEVVRAMRGGRSTPSADFAQAHKEDEIEDGAAAFFSTSPTYLVNGQTLSAFRLDQRYALQRQQCRRHSVLASALRRIHPPSLHLPHPLSSPYPPSPCLSSPPHSHLRTFRTVRERLNSDGLYVINATPFPLAISLDQVGPLYWENVVLPSASLQRPGIGYVYFSIVARPNPAEVELITQRDLWVPIIQFLTLFAAGLIGLAIVSLAALVVPGGQHPGAGFGSHVVTGNTWDWDGPHAHSRILNAVRGLRAHYFQSMRSSSKRLIADEIHRCFKSFMPMGALRKFIDDRCPTFTAAEQDEMADTVGKVCIFCAMIAPAYSICREVRAHGATWIVECTSLSAVGTIDSLHFRYFSKFTFARKHHPEFHRRMEEFMAVVIGAFKWNLAISELTTRVISQSTTQ